MKAGHDGYIDEDNRQLELIELLDERFRLKGDPARRAERERTYARLRETLDSAVIRVKGAHDDAAG